MPMSHPSGKGQSLRFDKLGGTKVALDPEAVAAAAAANGGGD